MDLIIRTDADSKIGIGHFMRCLALAQAWKSRGGSAKFITACDNEGLLKRLNNEGFQVIHLERTYPDSVDWKKTSQVLSEHSGAWVVLDGYHFDSSYHRSIKNTGHQLLVIDDMAHLDHYYADVVLNQNIHAKKLDYSCEPYTRLLLGTRYVLLRNEFLRWHGRERVIPDVARKFLVTLGGADPENQTLKIILSLQLIEKNDLEAIVVVGTSNPHFRTLETAIRNTTFPIQLVHNPSNIAELMAWADLGVSAGGTTCWEMAFMGLPNLIMILAENQREIAQGLYDHGVALMLGWYTEIGELTIANVLKNLMFNSVNQKAMSKKGQKLVEGNGAKYVFSIMDTLTHSDITADRLHVRYACFKDAELLWQWANDHTVRSNSFHPESIPFDKHIAWYKEKLASHNTRIWILELNQVPVAQVRYESVDTYTAEIHFSVASDYRGKGIGTESLVLTSVLACKELTVERLRGIVFKSNVASARTFKKAGFECTDEKWISGNLCTVFVMKCSKNLGGLL